ncbi:MAG: glutaminyl-tRNA synthetase [Gammaproteobacteria bacterium]|jgi:glutaminyl-tRNA synthetase
MNTKPLVSSNFIRKRIDQDIADSTVEHIVTRFPPEPNGYLHIGHAKSICLNFGIARDYNGTCYLRFDDTNPEKEDSEFVESIKRDVEWLGFDWQDNLSHSSEYFDQLYDYAVDLIKQGLAYVCNLSAEEMRAGRGTLTGPGTDSPNRTRSIEENLDLFKRMKEGEFTDGQQVLRAKIDMASPNINLRDPVLYRIKHQTHQNTGDKWCIYPMYDFTHCLSDAQEGVTHSLCTLEFEDNRALYDWVLDNLTPPARPHQIEFSRLNLDYTVLSKRMLTQLVSEGDVDGWDDPRMPTLSGLRRRGYTAAAIRDFCDRIGITKKNNRIEYALLENSIREDLDHSSERRMAVLDPLKLVISNYPEEPVDDNLDAINHPNQPELGVRSLQFSRELYVERSDFMIDPPRKFFRLGPGREVRLRYAYLVTCTGYDVDENGEPSVIYCTYDPDSRGGNAPDGRKVKGTIHWVSAEHAINAEVRLYDRLFSEENPTADKQVDFRQSLNRQSLKVIDNAKLEPALGGLIGVQRFQFERSGYFCSDLDYSEQTPVFNRTVTLRDSWAKKR